MKDEEKCDICGGTGEIDTMESVYPGTADAHIQAPIGTEKCPNCLGDGKEPDDETVKERLIESNLEKLQEYFVNDEREVGGRGITKDNCEDLFDSWVVDLDLDELITIIYKHDKRI